ncbi:signal peptidase I [Streptomyces sp. NPDC060194]|uniref:signal peptidase I n=1 Tax=Streptomyces sp. NPDC060194 TaxID=3347069 RepID=UPI00365F7F1F
MAVGARSGGEEPEERPDRPPLSGGTDPGPDGADGRRVPDDGGGREGGGHGGSGDDDAFDEDGAGGRKPKKQRSFWKELPLLIVIALILSLFIKTFLVQAFSIPSGSMQNTLQLGDRVLVDKLTPWFGSEPKRGEVVVFHDPADWLEGTPTAEPNAVQKFLSFIGLMPSAEEKDLIKRVIAVGGDTVECKKGGKVKVNGVELNETSFVFPGNTPCDDRPFGPVKVPEDRLWVMGDHRQSSADSRWHQEDGNGGFVPVDDVVGRAIVIAWPIGNWATLPIPETFEQPGIDKQSRG